MVVKRKRAFLSIVLLSVLFCFAYLAMATEHGRIVFDGCHLVQDDYGCHCRCYWHKGNQHFHGDSNSTVSTCLSGCRAVVPRG